MNIKIIAVGKVKEKYYKEAVSEYSKRLSKYCHVNILELADEKTSENMSLAEENIIKNREAERILKHIRGKEHIISLAIEGRSLSSGKFSHYINEQALKGKSNLVFIIGGSIGLSDDILKMSDLRLSFSSMTFPHQLMRVILLEQIYRAYRIINNAPYHK